MPSDLKIPACPFVVLDCCGVLFARLRNPLVHAVELEMDVAPGVVGCDLSDAHEQWSQPSELDVGAIAVRAVMEKRTKFEKSFHVSAVAFYLMKLLIAHSGIGGVRRSPLARKNHLLSP